MRVNELQRFADVIDGLSNTSWLAEDASRPTRYRFGRVMVSGYVSGAAWADRDNEYITHGYAPDGSASPGPCPINCNNDNEIYSFHPAGAHMLIGDASVRLVPETTRFAEYGPLSGSTFSLGFTFAPGVGSFLQRQTVDADARKYFRLGSTSALLALRGRGFYSTGDNPDYFYFGGNMELRGYPYYGLSGNQGFFANAELRLPLIHLAATPIGILGPLRGTVFLGIAGARFKGQECTTDNPTNCWKFSTSEPGYSYVNDPIFGEPVTGWRLQDGRASWGFGLQLFFLGYPMHFDWVKYTDFATTSEGWDFSFWIGYDF